MLFDFGIKRLFLAASLTIVIGLGFSATADAATTHRFINNYTIEQIITEPDGIGGTIAKSRYFVANQIPADKKLRGAEGLYFEVTNDPEYCSNRIFRDGSGNFRHDRTARDGSACAATAENTAISVNNAGINYLFYQESPETIKTLSPGKTGTFDRVGNPSGVPSGAQVYVLQNSGKCPALLVKYTSGTWGFLAPEVTSTIQTSSASTYYQNIARSAGSTDVSGCRADSGGARERSEDLLASIVGADNGYWGSYDNISWYGLTGGRVKGLGTAVGPADSAKYLTGNVSNPIGGGTGPEGTADNAPPDCAVESVGWAICPLMNFIAGLNDRAFSVLSGNFLETESELLDNDQTKAAWENFRNIANGLFVIAFMAIIYAQMVGGRN